MANQCTAVGSYDDSSERNETLAEVSNGTTWTIEPTPESTSTDYRTLSGVSCTSATACTAVGYDSSSDAEGPLAEAWNGTDWAVQVVREPSGASGTSLSAVSCTSASACTAVGTYANMSGTTVPLIERWNGTVWAIQASSYPAGASYASLDGVSCPSLRYCVAVGIYGLSAQMTFGEEWNGTTWTMQSTFNYPGSQYNRLTGVSCASASACIAVGVAQDNGGYNVPVAEGWNGTDWTGEATFDGVQQDLEFDGVSCASASACIAVGDINDRTLEETWNGTSWRRRGTANHGADPSYLDGISCVAVSACTAVGIYTVPGSARTLAEVWNGTGWKRSNPLNQ